MTTSQNKELLEKYVSEVWDKANLAALSDFLSKDFKRHTSPTGQPLVLKQQIERLKGFRSAFPDITITVEDVIAEGDLIAFRSTMRGTHRGDFAGIPATGRKVTVGLVDVIRVEDGRFAEQWGGPDLSDLIRQLTMGNEDST